MDLYERYNKGLREISAIGHVDLIEFVKEVENRHGVKINLGDVKLIWEIMKYKNNSILYVKCEETTRGAYALTTGVLK